MPLLDTAIIGAGPYGLSLAAHLRGSGASFQVLGAPMESWRDFMPNGMVLRSEPFASNLWDPARRYTFERFMQRENLPFKAVGKPVSLALFLQYAEWFRANAVGDVRNLKVESLRRSGESFLLDLSDGSQLAAARVVLATGHMPFRHIPPVLSSLPEPICLHSARLQRLEPFVDKDVLVVGAGQSALETAALLHEAGSRVTLMARTPRLKWNGGPLQNPTLIDHLREPEAGLGRGWRSLAISELPFLFRRLFPADKRHRYVADSWGPSGAWWLRERVEGKVATLMGRELRWAEARDGGVQVAIGDERATETLKFDRIIAATGFEVDIDRIDYLHSDLRAEIARELGGVPRLSSRFETSVPGLFIVGVASAPTFGPVMRFMFGAKHTAPRLARALRAPAHARPAPRETAATLQDSAR